MQAIATPPPPRLRDKSTPGAKTDADLRFQSRKQTGLSKSSDSKSDETKDSSTNSAGSDTSATDPAAAKQDFAAVVVTADAIAAVIPVTTAPAAAPAAAPATDKAAAPLAIAAAAIAASTAVANAAAPTAATAGTDSGTAATARRPPRSTTAPRSKPSRPQLAMPSPLRPQHQTRQPRQVLRWAASTTANAPTSPRGRRRSQRSRHWLPPRKAPLTTTADNTTDAPATATDGASRHRSRRHAADSRDRQAKNRERHHRCGEGRRLRQFRPGCGRECGRARARGDHYRCRPDAGQHPSGNSLQGAAAHPGAAAIRCERASARRHS